MSFLKLRFLYMLNIQRKEKLLTPYALGLCILIFSFTFSLPAFTAHAQELHQDVQNQWKARVVEVINQEERTVPGTDTKTTYQKIRVEILEGEKKGEIVTIENDFLALKKDQKFFLFYTKDINGFETYSVRDVDRIPAMMIFLSIFVIAIVSLGGKQGLRSLLSLAGSFFIILYVLVPSLLKGYPPVITSVVVAAIILFLAIYLTHGFNRESHVAFAGTVTAVILTGILAYVSVTITHLTGFGTDEAVYLNFATRGALNFSGLLLGGIMIGILGVLDDIAVTQAAIVSELYDTAPDLSRKMAYTKALRVGKEHVGALVNTLALAYTGVSLPLLLLFSTSESSLANIINQEIFAAEIIRTIVGSIGLVLTVPITTLLAVYVLKGHPGKHGGMHGHGHGHGHSHKHTH